MTFTNAQLLNVPFQRVFSRMTAAELKTVLTAQSLITGSGDDPPSEMTAEGALSYYDYNNGAGSYYETSPYRYKGGRYPNSGGTPMRGRDIRAALVTAFNANKASFLSSFSDARIAQLTRIAHYDASTPGATSKVVIWNQSQYSGVTPPASLSIMTPLDMFYDEGVANYTGATAATALAAKPAGLRCIKMGGYSGDFAAFWSIPTNSAATNNVWRQCFFNRSFDTFHQHGILCDTWHAAMTDANSTWRTFWEDLRSNGGANIIDHLILDAGEIVQPRFWKHATAAGPSPAVTGDVSVTIDTGTDILTSVGHNLETGQPFKFRTTSGTLPQISGGNVSTTLPYYVRRIDADTFYLHLTPGSALAAGTPRDFTNAGVSVKYRAYEETFENWFLDSDWATARDTILTPTLLQSVWNGYANWDIHSDERVFLFEAAYEKYMAEKWADVLQIALDEFPNLKISDYNLTYRCPATRSVYSAPALSHFPYGAGTKVGNLSSHSNYMQYDDRVWKWSTLTSVQQSLSNPSAALTWATLVQGVASMRSVLAADPDNIEMWVSPTAKAVSIPENDDMCNEFLLHMVLPSVARIGFYNSAVVSGQTAPSVAQQELALNLIAERDAIVAYTPATLDPEDDLNADYTRTYITTRVWAGARWVWRITFKPGTTYSITQIGDGVRVSPQGATAFFIPHAQIVNRVGTYASIGFWVTQLTKGSDGYPVAE